MTNKSHGTSTTHQLVQTQKGIKIDGKPITEQDILYLLSRFTGQTHDKDLEKVLDYWIMLKESGHNGFYLRAYHQDTTNKNEAIRIGSRHKRQKVK